MEERKGFGSNFGFLMAAVGSAVGLGNIWGFPNKMGASGGFTFLIIYLILAVLCGFIVMVGELAIGRKTGKGAVAAYHAISKKFKWMGWMGILSAFFILFFYCALGGYCIKYTVLNIGDLFGAGFGSNGLSGGEIFGNFLGSPAEGVIYGLIFVALTMLIVMGGVGGGIEKVCSVGMPALFVALLICIIRACTLEGTDVAVQILQADGSLVEGVVNGSALDGLKYMFSPGWAANVGYYVPAKAVVDGAEVSSIMVNGVAQAIVAYKSGAPSIFNVVSTAGGQMFFSLSLGMGAMITYGSYLQKKENIQKNALLIVVMDTLVALMAGLCVLPGRFALDPSGAVGGPSLLFVTMQNVFSRMGGLGPIFGILFYLLVVFAAISSSISLLEVIVAHFVDKARDEGKGDKRKSYTLIAAACVCLGCILVCADRLGASSFSPAELLNIANPKTWAADWLDFWDALSEGVMMPLGALLMSIMVGWEPITSGMGNTPKAWFTVALAVTILMLLFQLFTLFGVRERKDMFRREEEKTTLRGMWEVLTKNDQLLWTTLAMSLFNIGYMSTTTMAIYYMQYVYGNKDMYAVLAAVVGMAQLLALVIFQSFSKRMPREKLYLLATILVMIGYAIFFFAEVSIILIAVGALFIFIGQAFIQLLMLMFLEDAIEYGQWKNGKRSESITLGAAAHQ